MKKKTIILKEKIGTIIGGIIIITAIGALVYDKFFYKPEAKIPSASESKALEQKLIDRYGSLENIPEPENPCSSGNGHPLDNCW